MTEKTFLWSKFHPDTFTCDFPVGPPPTFTKVDVSWSQKYFVCEVALPSPAEQLCFWFCTLRTVDEVKWLRLFYLRIFGEKKWPSLLEISQQISSRYHLTSNSRRELYQELETCLFFSFWWAFQPLFCRGTALSYSLSSETLRLRQKLWKLWRKVSVNQFWNEEEELLSLSITFLLTSFQKISLWLCFITGERGVTFMREKIRKSWKSPHHSAEMKRTLMLVFVGSASLVQASRRHKNQH